MGMDVLTFFYILFCLADRKAVFDYLLAFFDIAKSNFMTCGDIV